MFTTDNSSNPQPTKLTLEVSRCIIHLMENGNQIVHLLDDGNHQSGWWQRTLQKTARVLKNTVRVLENKPKVIQPAIERSVAVEVYLRAINYTAFCIDLGRLLAPHVDIPVSCVETPDDTDMVINKILEHYGIRVGIYIHPILTKEYQYYHHQLDQATHLFIDMDFWPQS